MKRTILSVYLFFCIQLICNAQVTFEVNQIQDIDGRVEGFLEAIQLQIFNNSSEPLDVHLLIEISGLGGTLYLSNLSSFEDGELNLAPSGIPNAYSLLDINNIYNGFDIDEIREEGMVPIGFEEYVLAERRLPPGDYRTCVSVFAVDDGTNYGQSCLDTEVPILEPPLIVNPVDLEEPVSIPFEDNINVSWVEFTLSTGEYTLELKRLQDNAQLDEFVDQGKPNDFFDLLEDAILPIQFIESLSYNISDDDGLSDLLNGDYLAVRVTSQVEGVTFENEGRSNIVVFRYGDTDILLNPPVLELPLNFSNINEESDPMFRWSNPTTTLGTEIEVRHNLVLFDLGDIGVNSIGSNEEFSELLNEFSGDEMVNGMAIGITEWSIGGEGVEIEGPITMEEGKKYAAMLIAQPGEDYYFETDKSNVVNFTYGEEATAPILNLPEDDGLITHATNPQFEWTLPTFDYGTLLDVQSTLSVLDLTELGIDNIADFNEFLTHTGGTEMAVGVESPGHKYPIPGAILTDNPIELVEGRRYAAVVRCTSSDYEGIADNGYSNVVNFTYESAIDPPELVLPSDDALLDGLEDPIFQWTPPSIDGVYLNGFRTKIIVIDLQEAGVIDINTQEEFLNIIDNQDIEMVDGVIGDATNYSFVIGFEDDERPIRLVEGRRYVVCVQALMNDGTAIRDNGYSNFRSFNYGREATAPVITTPEQDGIVDILSDPAFAWDLPQVEGADLRDVRTILAVLDLEEIGEFHIDDVDHFKEHLGEEMAYGFENSINTYRPGLTEFVDTERPIFFEEGKKYAAVVQCRSDEFPAIANGGYSEVINFWYGFAEPPVVCASMFSEVSSEGDGDSSNENAETDCATACELDMPSGAAISTLPDDLGSIQAGYFAINELDVTKTGGSMTGKGVVTVPFLNDVKIKVDLKNVRINEQRQMLSGEITAHQDESPFSDDFLTDTESAVSDRVQSFNEFLTGAVNAGRVLSHLVLDEAIGMPLGIDQTIQGHTLLIGITDMVFTPRGATVKLLYEHKFDELGADNYISLRGDVCMKPSGLDANVLLALNRDFAITDFAPNSEVSYMTFKGSSSDNPTEVKNTATHIEFNCTCVKSFGIQVEANLSEERFIKDFDNEPVEGPVGLRFGIRLNRELACNPGMDLPLPREHFSKNNFMMNLEMDPFQIVGLEGWGFKVDDAYVDLSTLENPTGMRFPVEYDHAATTFTASMEADDRAAMQKTWTGFYLKELKIRAPKDFYDSNDDRRFAAGLENVIIDETGLTLVAAIENIVSVETGNAGGWAFSIDEFKVALVQNAFRSGSLEGQIGLPITAPGDNMGWEAALYYYSPTADDSDDEGSSEEDSEEGEEESNWGFVLGIDPSGRVNFPPFMATADLDNNSHILFKWGKVHASEYEGASFGTGNVSLSLSGHLNIGSQEYNESAEEPTEENVSDERVNKKIPTDISFQGMKFAFRYNKKRGFYDERLGFASPQKRMGASLDDEEESTGMSGFPVTIRDWSISSNIELGQCVGANINIEPELNLMGEEEGGFKAAVKLKIPMVYDQTDKRFKIRTPEVGCVSIGIAGSGGSEQNGITLEGEVCFYNNEPRCSEPNATGLKGNLLVGLPVAQVQLAAEFGDTGEYRYWFVDGKVGLESGIAIGPISIIGIGGGFYYNMSLGDAASTEDENGYNKELVQEAAAMHTASSSDGPPAEIPRQFNPCPQEGNIAMKLILPIATTGDASVFNMDISASASFNPRQGTCQFQLIGDGYVMADIDERPTAPIKADIDISYTKTEESKIFHAQFAAYCDYQVSGVPIALKGNTSQRAFDGKVRSQLVMTQFHVAKYSEEDILWYFKFGGPNAAPRSGENTFPEPGPAGLKITLGNNEDATELGQVGMYFQMGNHDISNKFMPLPDLIEAIFDKAKTMGEGGGLDTTDEDVIDGDEDRVDERQYTTQNYPDSGAGFSMGLKFETDIDIDAFLLYAKLAFAVGFDVNMVKTGQESCILTSGELVEPFGFNGFYARGRFYAAIAGELGLQIKLIRTRRLALFEIGAAFVIEGGFPSPTWAQGRAAIYFALLGGLIEGSADMEFKLGDRCAALKEDPFGIPLVQEFNPHNEKENVDPYVMPQVSFYVSMNQELALPILDEAGEPAGVEYLTPILNKEDISISVKRKGESEDAGAVDTSIDFVHTWKEDNKLLQIRPLEAVEDAEVTVAINIHAKERRQIEDSHLFTELEDVYWEGEQWFQNSSVVFTTKDLPDVIQGDQYAHSVPCKNQRYYLQSNTVSQDPHILFRGDMRNDYFMSNDENGSYDYKILFYPYNAEEPLIRNVQVQFYPALGNMTKVSWEPVPFENEMIYRAVLVREKTEELLSFGGSTLFGSISGIGLSGSLDSGEELSADTGTSLSLGSGIDDLDLSLEDQFQYAGIHEDLFENGEIYTQIQVMQTLGRLQPGSWSSLDAYQKIFEFHFKTSQFNSLEEKLSAASFTYADEWPKVDMSIGEGFDEIDIYEYHYNYRGERLYSYPALVSLLYSHKQSNGLANNYFDNLGIATKYNQALSILERLDDQNHRHTTGYYGRIDDAGYVLEGYGDYVDVDLDVRNKLLRFTNDRGNASYTATLYPEKKLDNCEWEDNKHEFESKYYTGPGMPRRENLALGFANYTFGSISSKLQIKDVEGVKTLLDNEDIDSEWEATLTDLAAEIGESDIDDDSDESLLSSFGSILGGFGFSGPDLGGGIDDDVIEYIGAPADLRVHFVPINEVFSDFNRITHAYQHWSNTLLVPQETVSDIAIDDDGKYCRDYVVLRGSSYSNPYHIGTFSSFFDLVDPDAFMRGYKYRTFTSSAASGASGNYLIRIGEGRKQSGVNQTINVQSFDFDVNYTPSSLH